MDLLHARRGPKLQVKQEMPMLIDLMDFLMTLSHLLKNAVPASASVLLSSNTVLLSLGSKGKYPLASVKAEYRPKYTRYSDAPSLTVKGI